MNKVGKSKDGENVFYFVFYSLDKMEGRREISG